MTIERIGDEKNETKRKNISEHKQLYFGVAIQNKILFFYLLCCSTNRKHTQNISWAQNKHNSPSRRKLRSFVQSLQQCVHEVSVWHWESVRVRENERAKARWMQLKPEFFAIYLIWSLDVALRTFEDDSCLVCGLMAIAIKWHTAAFAIPNELSLFSCLWNSSK